MEDENITKEWHWESFSSSGLEDIFTNEQIVNLLNNEREIEIGWILRKRMVESTRIALMSNIHIYSKQN